MSMNGFFVAFTPSEIDTMQKNNALIDQWVWEEEKYSVSTDVETAWDVLNQVLDGVGFNIDVQIDDALSNGCSLILAQTVKNQAQNLSMWTHEHILANLQNLDENADLYHLEVFQDEPDYLLAQFDKLVAFYTEAAEKNLAALFYFA